MKILIAAWHLKDSNVGIGRYCRALIEALGRVDCENDYVILVPEEVCIFPAASNIQFRVLHFPLFKRRFWELVVPLITGTYDLVHFPYDAGIVWRRGKVVMTVHDVKPLIFPELRSRKNLYNIIHDVVLGNKWSKVDHMVTVSECSRRDIARYLGFPLDKISVIHQGVSPQLFHPLDKNGSQVNLSGRPYVLSVAGNDPTKNLLTLIEAFSRLPSKLRQAYDLVLAGDLRKRQDLRQQVDRVGLEKQTQFLGSISDRKLLELYQQAALFVFPSRYEGFGLPVLEAMACGCPVISSNASSLPEVAGDAALFVEPLDIQGFSEAIEQLLTDQTLRESYIAKGLSRVQGFSWDRTAQETVEIYRKVLGPDLQ